MEMHSRLIKNDKKIFLDILNERLKRHSISSIAEESFFEFYFWIGPDPVDWRLINYKKYTENDIQNTYFGILDPVKTIILDYYTDEIDEWIIKYKNITSATSPKIINFIQLSLE